MRSLFDAQCPRSIASRLDGSAAAFDNPPQLHRVVQDRDRDGQQVRANIALGRSADFNSVVTALFDGIKLAQLGSEALSLRRCLPLAIDGRYFARRAVTHWQAHTHPFLIETR